MWFTSQPSRRSYSAGQLSTPKSGRSRTVELSKRLFRALRDAWIATGQPEGGLVCPNRSGEPLDENNYRRRVWTPLCVRAEIGAWRMKDLRDTYASTLLSAGIPLAYVSAQLGHADVATTARHYARWIGTEYREPERLEPGEIAADLIARAGKSAVQNRYRSATLSLDA